MNNNNTNKIITITIIIILYFFLLSPIVDIYIINYHNHLDNHITTNLIVIKKNKTINDHSQTFNELTPLLFSNIIELLTFFLTFF